MSRPGTDGVQRDTAGTEVPTKSTTASSADVLAPRYLRAECGVRYWEDGIVNGVEDEEGTLIPHRSGDAWCPVIDLVTGRVLDWPRGTRADTHYKVCDAGRYTLLDEGFRPLTMIDGYVPKMLSPGGVGFGDYVIMTIGPDGVIENWRCDLAEFRGKD